MQDKKKAIVYTCAWAIVFVFAFLFLVFIAPNKPVFSNVHNLSVSYGKKIYLNNGDNVEQTFKMHFNRFSGVELGLGKENKKGSATVFVEVFDLDGRKLLSGSTDQLVFKDGWNRFDDTHFTAVDPESECKICIHVENAAKDDIYLMADSLTAPYGATTVNGHEYDGNLVANVWGTFRGSELKTQFVIFYVILALLVLAMIYSILSKKTPFYFDTIRRNEKILLFAMFFISAIFVSTDFDLHMIIKGGYKVVDALRHGQLHRFYDWIYEGARANGDISMDIFNYNILLYVFAAIVTAPFMAFTSFDSPFLVIYFQIVISALVVYSAFLLKKVVKDFGADDKFASRSVILYLASSMTLYATVGYGQVDVIYVILMLLSFRFYARKRYIAFSFVMSIAIAFKFFPLLVFIPLVLLVQKRLKGILLCAVVGASVPALFQAIFGGSAGYKAMGVAAEDTYYFIDRLTASNIGSGDFTIILMVALYVIFCIYIFSKKVDLANRSQILMYLGLCGLIAYTVFMCLVEWNTQWIYPYALFFAMLLPFFQKTDVLMYCSWGMELMYILIFSIRGVPVMEDVNYCILPIIGKHYYHGAKNIGIWLGDNRTLILNMCVTIFVAVSVYIAAYMLKNADSAAISYEKTHEPAKISRPLLWARPAMLAGLYLFFFWCFYFMG